jgi:hypothetical protein
MTWEEGSFVLRGLILGVFDDNHWQLASEITFF